MLQWELMEGGGEGKVEPNFILPPKYNFKRLMEVTGGTWGEFFQSFSQQLLPP
jgi:hypothetical protein